MVFAQGWGEMGIVLKFRAVGVLGGTAGWEEVQGESWLTWLKLRL